jgi:ribulose 1,5-bisphosphate synthetase/thiazole synthase
MLYKITIRNYCDIAVHPITSYYLRGKKMKVIIVGAGIGGLGAAVALNRAGHDVEVIYESFPWASS